LFCLIALGCTVGTGLFKWGLAAAGWKRLTKAFLHLAVHGFLGRADCGLSLGRSVLKFLVSGGMPIRISRNLGVLL
jgi:hypothetical protein